MCAGPQLRRALHDVEEVADKDDHYFLRWLRARKFNVARAEDMLRKVRLDYIVLLILAQNDGCSRAWQRTGRRSHWP